MSDSPVIQTEGPARHSPETPMTYTGATHPQLKGKTCKVRHIHQGGFFAGRHLWAKFDDPATGYGSDWHLFIKGEFSLST